MPIPKLVIVGRPNVGKSSLFNWLIGQRIAIVDPTAGVTRDRVQFLYEFDERFLELVDTGGMGIEDRDGLTEDVERQIQIALDEADLVLFVVDAYDGVLPLDELVAERLRALDKPVVVVANKCDSPKSRANAAAEFHRFGRDLVFVSTAHNIGREDLWTAILARFPDPTETASDPVMKIAVVGRRNAGKSTFINQLAKEERMIVSEVAGTTRDSVDIRFEHNGRIFVAIDTAGVRRNKSLNDPIDFYGFSRVQRTIRRADIVLYFISAEERLGQVDVRLAKFILEQHKPCIIVVNKWDLVVGKAATEDFSNYLDRGMPTLQFAPRAFITAKTGRNVSAVIDLAATLFKEAGRRASTAEVNRALRETVARKQAPLRHNRTLKMFYATQAAVYPPTIVVFCNQPTLVDPQYAKFLNRMLRERLGLEEIPLRLVFRRRGEDDGEGSDDAEAEGVADVELDLETEVETEVETEAEVESELVDTLEADQADEATPEHAEPSDAEPSDAKQSSSDQENR